ncbi:enhancer of split mbeta protein-like [Bacillus rossius redtenbacheri]|uniref:enhancer of split mbeta protein-like n=1 Tax=Bacillus rossius redtenbacheri TaxID=93214 RepID=UPI002FDE611D
MEKRRRARINHSLDELRRMLDSERPGGSRASKLEKADILELTVERLQRLRRDHEALKKRLEGGGGQEAARRFRAGYRECAREAARLLGAAAPALRQRLARHLAARLCQLELPAVRPTRLAGGDLALVTAAGPGRDEDPRGPVWRPWTPEDFQAAECRPLPLWGMSSQERTSLGRGYMKQGGQ